jgi:hypothetical protein
MPLLPYGALGLGVLPASFLVVSLLAGLELAGPNRVAALLALCGGVVISVVSLFYAYGAAMALVDKYDTGTQLMPLFVIEGAALLAFASAILVGRFPWLAVSAALACTVTLIAGALLADEINVLLRIGTTVLGVTPMAVAVAAGTKGAHGKAARSCNS